MIPTVEQARTRMRALLDDDDGNVFTDAICQEAIAEAFDVMYSAMLASQIPRIKPITTYTLPALATSLTPATVGISNFGELVSIEERQSGSTVNYAEVFEVETLPQREQGTALQEFTWREDTWQFLGATQARQLRITYFSSGTAPSTGSLGVDGCLNFIAKYAASAAGPRKGYDEIVALKYKAEAVGPRYDEGIMGGELFRLIQPMERSLQRTPIAPRPYTTQLWRRLRAVPHIAAPPTSGGSMPEILTSSAGQITGDQDGVNTIFFLPYSVTRVSVFVGGIQRTPTSEFTHSTNVLTFIAPYIPVPGQEILVQAWL